jgi:hypothetical protein
VPSGNLGFFCPFYGSTANHWVWMVLPTSDVGLPPQRSWRYLSPLRRAWCRTIHVMPCHCGPMGLFSASSLVSVDETSPPTMCGSGECHNWGDLRKEPGACTEFPPRTAGPNPPPVRLRPTDGHHPDKPPHATPCETRYERLRDGPHNKLPVVKRGRWSDCSHSRGSSPALTDPDLRANPYPKNTGHFWQLSLPTLF